MSNLVYWKVSLPMAQVLELDDIEGPYQPLTFYNSALSVSGGTILTRCLVRVFKKLVGYGHNHVMKLLIHSRLVLMLFAFLFITIVPPCDTYTELHTM